jgi:hypothetical protein
VQVNIPSEADPSGQQTLTKIQHILLAAQENLDTPSIPLRLPNHKQLV